MEFHDADRANVFQAFLKGDGDTLEVLLFQVGTFK